MDLPPLGARKAGQDYPGSSAEMCSRSHPELPAKGRELGLPQRQGSSDPEGHTVSPRSREESRRRAGKKPLETSLMHASSLVKRLGHCAGHGGVGGSQGASLGAQCFCHRHVEAFALSLEITQLFTSLGLPGFCAALNLC